MTHPNPPHEADCGQADAIPARRGALRTLSLLATGTALLAAGCSVAQVPFPNLTEAEEHLAAALSALERAPPRFGGHKAEAVSLIHAALNQIELARADFR